MLGDDICLPPCNLHSKSKTVVGVKIRAATGQVHDVDEVCVLVEPKPTEDRFGFGEVHGVLDNFTVAEQCIKDAFKMLGGECKGFLAGSTLAASLILNGKIITANAGDSAVMVFKRGGDGKFECIFETTPHTVENPGEIRRIEEVDGASICTTEQAWRKLNPNEDLGGGFTEAEKTEKRLNGILMPTRGFGDCDVGPGLSYEAEVVCIEASLADEVYVVHCTDGITDVLSVEDIAKTLKDVSPKLWTKTIRDDAFYENSRDDATVVITTVPAQRAERAILSFVADGHGGSKTAEFIQKHFLESLQYSVNLALFDGKLLRYKEFSQVSLEGLSDPFKKTVIELQQKLFTKLAKGKIEGDDVDDINTIADHALTIINHHLLDERDARVRGEACSFLSQPSLYRRTQAHCCFWGYDNSLKRIVGKFLEESNRLQQSKLKMESDGSGFTESDPLISPGDIVGIELGVINQ
jgi:serine/threonine protein phosphatase PrpC